MKINKVTWPGLLAILSFAALSVFSLHSSFNTLAGSHEPVSASKKETLKMLSSYRTWERINKHPIVFSSGLAISV